MYCFSSTTVINSPENFSIRPHILHINRPTLFLLVARRETEKINNNKKCQGEQDHNICTRNARKRVLYEQINLGNIYLIYISKFFNSFEQVCSYFQGLAGMQLVKSTFALNAILKNHSV